MLWESNDRRTWSLASTIRSSDLDHRFPVSRGRCHIAVANDETFDGMAYLTCVVARLILPDYGTHQIEMLTRKLRWFFVSEIAELRSGCSLIRARLRKHYFFVLRLRFA